MGQGARRARCWFPPRWDHWQAPCAHPQGLDWLHAFLLQPGILRPPQGSVALCTPTLAPAPFQASLTFGPSSSDKQRGRTRAHPHHRPFLAPKELGVLPARVRGSQLGINSSAGGGDRDFHSQSLQASHPGRAGPPSCCPLVLHCSPPLPSPRGSLTSLQPPTHTHAWCPRLVEPPWTPLWGGHDL